MKSTGWIDDRRFYDVLLRLRKAGAFFVPITSDEVLHHLGLASMTHDGAAETPGLRVLRQYLAAVVGMEEHLYLGGKDPPQNPVLEIQTLADVHRLAPDAVAAIWEKPGLDLETRARWSAWAWGSLFVGRFQRAPLPEPTDEGRRNLLTMALVRLLVDAIQLKADGDGSEPGLRSEYMKWVYYNVIGPLTSEDADLLERVARQYGNILLTIVEKDDQDEAQAVGEDARRQARAIKRVLLSRLVGDMPEELRNKVSDDPGVQEALQLRMATCLEFGGKRFLADAFWPAAAQALSQGRAEVTTVDGRERLELSLTEAGSQGPALRMTGALNGMFSDAALGLMSNEREARIAFLGRHRDSLDRPAEEFEALAAEIADIADAPGRMLAFTKERDATAHGAYMRLRAALEAGVGVEWPLFRPPSAAALLRHLRLDAHPGSGFKERHDAAAARLAAELGPVEALRRLAGLPFETPEALVDGLREMAVAGKGAVLKELARTNLSPLAVAQRVSVMRRLRDTLDLPTSAIQPSVAALVGHWPVAWKAQLEVLGWAGRVLEGDPDWRGLDSPSRLALVWTHAERVMSILIEARVDPAAIGEGFEQRDPRSASRRLLVDARYEGANAWPERLPAEAMMFHALGMAVDDQAPGLIPDDAREKLRSTLTIENDGQPIAHPLLVQHRGDDAGSPRSFLADPPIGLMEAVAGPAAAQSLGRQRSDEFIQHVLAIIEAEPNDAAAWLELGVLGPQWLRHSDRARVDALARKIDVVAALRRDRQKGLTLAALLADLAIRSEDPSAADLAAAQITNLSRFLAGEHPPSVDLMKSAGTDPARREATEVAEVVFSVSRRPTGPAAVEALAANIDAMVTTLPATLSLWRMAVERILRDTPFDWSAPLWKLLVQYRRQP